MQKSSRVGLLVSVGFFSLAGAVGFWPSDLLERIALYSITAGGTAQNQEQYAMLSPYAPAPQRSMVGGFRRPSSPRNELSGWISGGGDGPPPFYEEQRIDLDEQNVPIDEALARLFNRVGHKYVIDKRVQGRISVSIRDVHFVRALKTLLQASSQPLVCRVRNGVYIVSEGAAVTPAFAVSATPSAPPSAATGAPVTVIPSPERTDTVPVAPGGPGGLPRHP